METESNHITIQKIIQKEFKTKEKLPFETEVVTFPKKTILKKPGEIEKNIYLIRSGIIQVSLMDENNEENIIAFSFPGDITFSVSSFIKQKPSEYKVLCLQDCVLEIIPHDALYEAMEHSILANKLMRYVLEYAYMLRLTKQKAMLTQDATTRYKELLKNEPEVIKQIPIDKVAKYLGIHPRSLSRLRRLKND